MNFGLDYCPGTQKILSIDLIIHSSGDVQDFNPIVLMQCVVCELLFEGESIFVSLPGNILIIGSKCVL